MHKSIRNSIFQQLAFNRNNYARGLNYRERYHTRELMSFYFIFVTNFIRDQNPSLKWNNKSFCSIESHQLQILTCQQVDILAANIIA